MFDLKTFTLLHVVISLLALVAGIALLLAWRGGKAQPGLATATLVLLLATSITGFMFPFIKFLPSHAFGILSLILLAATVVARWGKGLAGRWLTVYGATLAIAVYLDAFVAVVQALQKIPALNALAPTDKSPGFMIAQGLLLVAFVLLGRSALRGLRGIA
ncbi:hypothetical protein C3942_18505 [Solimonas fluminis]|uniref:DUF2306 domain-containing protein n=1 Tax=Solimonas fluminis TaxID=2086571 RepID=A0A2S5TBY6_9GAMM|nr:hypothetical protein [Solimonas fluminis]PPE72531.1 hypothetical protein C3942_18505 [Solimonas fluminis]